MTTLTDKVSHLFTHYVVGVKTPKDVIDRAIQKYSGLRDPIRYINKHEASLLGRTCNDNHIELLFPLMFSDTTSSWFSGQPLKFINA